MNKVILVLSDALRYDVARANMGFLGHLVESRQAGLWRIRGELPSLSRPMYETIHTGVTAGEHGIVANSVVRRSRMPNVFAAAAAAGRVTAAAAYAWFSELYNRSPYDRIRDREVDDPALAIRHGRFYSEDAQPDAEVFDAAASLVRKFSPDYLLVHPMGMDWTGEAYGSDSKEYRNQAIRQDICLAPLIAEWLEAGYLVMVTGDHGINADGAHGGTTAEQRDVPLFIIPNQAAAGGERTEPASHLQIAPTILACLDVPIPSTMRAGPLSY